MASPTLSSRSRPRPLLSLGAALHFEAIGAPWRIDTRTPLSAATTADVHARIAVFDSAYSRFRDDSLVARIAGDAGEYEFPADAAALFALYRSLYEATGGAVSPLVGHALESLGYDRDYSLQAAPVPARVPAWDDAFAWNGHAFHAVRPVLIDVGAAGKGYLIDLVAEVLREHGVDEFLVDASGDLLHAGDDVLRVALEHPRDASRAIGIAELRGRSLCASAANRRSWGDGLHHVIDALTGLPTHEVIATWAIADDALTADGLATALFFASGEDLAGVGSFEWVRMLSTGRVEASAGFEGELFA